LPECLKIIWKHTTLFKDLTPTDAQSALEYLLKVYDKLNVTSTRELTNQIIDIAQTTKMAVYDATYIALTQKLNGTLYTADQKLAKTANTITKIKLLKP
jgi:predicted nucleic acid-binding protein